LKAYHFARKKQELSYSYQGWESYFKKLRYKKPFVINGYEINDFYKEDLDLETERDEANLPNLPMNGDGLSSDEERERTKFNTEQEKW
jgi:hypothetical protein